MACQNADNYFRNALPYWDLNLCRKILKNNKGMKFYSITISATLTKFIPVILVEQGLFTSNSEVKRNRPDLFREFIEGEAIKVSGLELILRSQ